jgi:hypothetical protein
MVLGLMDTHLYHSQKCSDHPTDQPYGHFALDIDVPVKFRRFDYMVNYLFNTIIIACIWCWAQWIHIYTTVTNVPITCWTGPTAALPQIYLYK